MQFRVDSLTRCSGQRHWTFALTFGGGQTVTLRADLEEVQGEPPEDVVEARERILDRLRSALKEAGAATFAQARAVVEGQVYKV